MMKMFCFFKAKIGLISGQVLIVIPAEINCIPFNNK